MPASKVVCCTTLSTSTNTAVTDVLFRGHEWLRSWECNLKQNHCGLYLGLSQQREFRSLAASTRSGLTLPQDKEGAGSHGWTPGTAACFQLVSSHSPGEGPQMSPRLCDLSQSTASERESGVWER